MKNANDLQAFVHLLPTAFTSLNDPCLPDLFTKDYPALPGAIMLMSLFSLFCIELWLNNKTGGHSHGGATGEGLTGGPPPPALRGANIGPPPTRRPSTPAFPEGMEGYPDEKRAYAKEYVDLSEE